MTAEMALARKELLEASRSWKTWLLLGAFLFFAVSGVLTARYLNEWLMNMAGDDSGLRLPPPIPLDAWAQWTKNLGQLGILLIIVTSAGELASEVRTGTVIPVLTKPISRSSFVLVKFVISWLILVAITVVTTGVNLVLTILLFDADQFGPAPIPPLLAATAVWLVQASMYMALAFLASSLTTATMGAVGMSIGVWFVVGMATLWEPAIRYSPVGIGSVVTKLGADSPYDFAWPVATTLLTTGVLLAGAVLIFRRKEL